jgi:hypothetical protein
MFIGQETLLVCSLAATDETRKVSGESSTPHETMLSKMFRPQYHIALKNYDDIPWATYI